MSESCTSNDFGLIRRKCVHPHDYIDRSVETEFPSQNTFFSKLYGSPCSDSEYTHATRVWDVFRCKTIADYHDMYLQLDVLLLADFFEKFRKTCLEFYNLDPLHYHTTPGPAWDAALRLPRVGLQLITENDMYKFVENSIRGGISMVSTRRAQANNPSFPDTYDANLPNQHLIYLDANNLYGRAISQSLPTHRFRFLQQEEISALKQQDLSDDDEDGYIFEVDLHYPTSLHNQHDDYPLAPESLVIYRIMYSPTQHSVFPESAPQKKLTPNLREKVKYAVYSRNLKLYLQLGLVVTKVHRVLTFKQSPWLKTYIGFNTRHRSLAGISFLKDFFKLMNNSVFGKTQEYLRNRVHVERKRRVIGNPITDCLTGIQCRVQTLTLNRPIYVGFTVLQLTKLHMYDFHYNHMNVKYPHAKQLRLLFTDTDSLAYAVHTDDIYKDMATGAADRHDFSEYLLDHPLYGESNRKSLGFFKGELNSVPMREFVGLRPKCFVFLCTGKVDKNVVQHTCGEKITSQGSGFSKMRAQGSGAFKIGAQGFSKSSSLGSGFFKH